VEILPLVPNPCTFTASPKSARAFVTDQLQEPSMQSASGGLIEDAKPVSFEHRSAEPAGADPSTWTAGGGVAEE
jgi:hypothetical protein